MEKIVVSFALFLMTAGFWILSFRSFREKGFLFNNAYIYASKQERKRMNRKPFYRQSFVVFLLVGLGFALSALAFLLEKDWMFWLEGIVIAAAVIYAVVSSIFLAKQQRSDKGKAQEEGEDHST